MIKIIGPNDCDEFIVSVQIKDALVKLWPTLEQEDTEVSNVLISTSVKLSGYKIQDIDIVLLCHFDKPKLFKPTRALRDTNGDLVNARPVQIHNLVAAIEVKGHTSGGIRVQESQIQVAYGNPPKWKSATDQNRDQMFSLKSYFSDRHIELYTKGCLVFTGVPSITAPGAVAGQFSGAGLMTALCAGAPMLSRRGMGYVSAGDTSNIERAFNSVLFKEISPSELSRKAMDRIVSRSELVDRVIENANTNLTILRGHGGSGKTVILLQAAWRLFQNSGSRTLLLTYNQALASDIKRLMSLLGVPASCDSGGILVETVMTFMMRWANRLGVSDEDEADLKHYPALTMEIVELIQSGALTPEDIQEVKEKWPENFAFDYVFVDEGQDWPADEVRLVQKLYSAEVLTVADGMHQLVRDERADWTSGQSQGSIQYVSLNICLRLKKNLTVFANSVGTRANLGWKFSPNPEGSGGQVILLKTPYENNADLHRELLSNLSTQDNAPIDMLFCVPASGVKSMGESRSSHISEVLETFGTTSWDGVDSTCRRDMPRSKEDVRIVQYESCRGLEGWIVVLDRFDEFLQSKYNERLVSGLTRSEREAFEDIEEVAMNYAISWALIPLSRPIDTLVIGISDETNTFSKILIEAASAHEFVEYP